MLRVRCWPRRHWLLGMTDFFFGQSEKFQAAASRMQHLPGLRFCQAAVHKHALAIDDGI